MAKTASRRIEFMAVPKIEPRVAALESEVTQLKQRLDAVTKPARPWWQEIYGTFDNDPIYEEAMRLGREVPRIVTSETGETTNEASIKTSAGCQTYGSKIGPRNAQTKTSKVKLVTRLTRCKPSLSNPFLKNLFVLRGHHEIAIAGAQA